MKDDTKEKPKLVYGLHPQKDVSAPMIKHTDLLCPFCNVTFEVKEMMGIPDSQYMFSRNPMFRRNLYTETYDQVVLICPRCGIEVSGLKHVIIYFPEDEDDKNKNTEEPRETPALPDNHTDIE